MRRRSDWETRLSEYLAGIRRKPHAYGSHDCLVGLTAGAIRAQTGKDLARGHRRKYDSQAKAIRYLRSLGHDSFESYLGSLLEEKPLGFVQRGDIVLVEDDDGQRIPGVCMGEYALVIASDGLTEGLKRVPPSRWLKAWAV